MLVHFWRRTCITYFVDQAKEGFIMIIILHTSAHTHFGVFNVFFGKWHAKSIKYKICMWRVAHKNKFLHLEFLPHFVPCSFIVIYQVKKVGNIENVCYFDSDIFYSSGWYRSWDVKLFWSLKYFPIPAPWYISWASILSMSVVVFSCQMRGSDCWCTSNAPLECLSILQAF